MGNSEMLQETGKNNEKVAETNQNCNAVTKFNEGITQNRYKITELKHIFNDTRLCLTRKQKEKYERIIGASYVSCYVCWNYDSYVDGEEYLNWALKYFKKVNLDFAQTNLRIYSDNKLGIIYAYGQYKKGEKKRKKEVSINKFIKVFPLDDGCAQVEYKIRNISQKIRLEVFKKDKYTCMYCGHKNILGGGTKDIPLTIDHIVPINFGGSDDISNLQTMCLKCNIKKSDKIYARFVK